MNDPAPTDTLEVQVPDSRPCTRCDGTQHLVAEHQGLGKYRCEHCEMVIGFDLDADPSEFLLHRGLPSRYSKQWFGAQLTVEERRLGGPRSAAST